MSLTPQARVKMALNFHEPDRPPIQTYLTPEIHAALSAHFNGRDPQEALEVDFRYVGADWRGPLKPSHDDVSYDMWGIGYHHISNQYGSYKEACDLALARVQTMDEVGRYPWPRLEDCDFSTIAQQCDQARPYATIFGSASMPDIVNGVSRGRGMEQVLMDIALEDEVGVAIIDRRVDFFYEFIKRAMEAGQGKIDILHLGEDCGSQNGRLFSPEVFNRFFVPRLKKFIDVGHQYGAKVMLHSCGDTHEIIPTFIEMGLDVLDSMQPEPPGMNPERLKALSAGQLSLCGLISTQATLPHGTVQACRAEARHRLDVIAKGGGYIFAPAHCIQPDTPLENVLAVYEEAIGRPLS